MIRYLNFLLLLLFFFSACTIPEDIPVLSTAPYLRSNTTWADSTLASMTLNEKIGQLIILKSNLKNKSTQDSMYQWIATGKTGGLLLHDLPLATFREWTALTKELSHVPLLIGTEEKVALHNQFSDVVHFPQPASIASLPEVAQQKAIEKSYLQQCDMLGINFCMSPSLFENKNTSRSYNFQAFEQDTRATWKRSQNLLSELTKRNILTFGDNFSDYYNLEQDTTNFLDSVLYKYYHLTSRGLSGLKMDETVFKFDGWNSLQPYYLQQYLQSHLSFNGLMMAEISDDIFIDRLIHSGVDLFIANDDIGDIFNTLKRWVNTGLMPQNVLDAKVRKVLLAKNWVQDKDKKNFWEATKHNNLAQKIKEEILPEQFFKQKKKAAKAMFASHSFRDIFLPDAFLNVDEERYNIPPTDAYFKNNGWQQYVQRLYEESIVLANNPKNTLPFINIYKQDYKIFKYSKNSLATFETYFEKYAPAETHSPDEHPEKNIRSLPVESLRKSTTILVLDQIDLDSLNYLAFIQSVNALSQTSKVILINFGNPYNLQYFNENLTVIHSFEHNIWTESIVAQLLFGGTSTSGKLPIQISDDFPKGAGTSIQVSRLKYTYPEEVGIDAKRLQAIDSIALAAIQAKAFPGCQVLVAKDGKIVYDKTFGFHTYDQKHPVKTSDLFDVASITKVAATTLAAMKLNEQGEFDILDRLQDHVEMNKRSVLRYIRLRDLFIHKSGLQANMPIAKYLSRNDSIVENCNRYYCDHANEPYTLKIADDLYINKYYADTIWMDLQKLKVDKRRHYKYSDVNFYLLQKVVETKTGIPLDDYVSGNFYHPLGLQFSGFNPLNKVSADQIVPTALDSRWRKQLLQGYVHDETAAINGGVAGNAGLFMSAEEMAILFQMLLNGGVYGNTRYFKEETIKNFTTAKYGNHRGLGFDKPNPRSKGYNSSYAASASNETFGHNGFTGTCVWADPEENLIYIFLSNRIHPNVKNKVLSKDHVRSKIHQVIYDALGTYKETY